MKKQWVGSLAFAALSLTSVVASANYVCMTSYQPGSGTTGSYGVAVATLYSGADCTGSFIGYYYYCSTGATSASCAASSTYWATSDDELAFLGASLVEAVARNIYVSQSTTPCIGGGSGCLAWLYYQGL